jgi:biopolymer transport protein ExbB
MPTVRPYLRLLLAVGAALWLAAPAWGQAPATRPTHISVNPFALVADNLDFVFWIILACSITGVTLIIQGFIKARASVIFPADTTLRLRAFIENRQFRELLDYTETDRTFVSQALNAALKRAPNFPAMREAMETSVGEQTADHFRRIEYLNIIGNLGPLLGLLGTVLGMIDAFQQMHLQQGQADPSALADGISKALCHTMLGLMLALPCLAAFGVLRTLVDRLTVQAALLAEELLLMIRPAERPPGPPVPQPAVPVRPASEVPATPLPPTA